MSSRTRDRMPLSIRWPVISTFSLTLTPGSLFADSDAGLDAGTVVPGVARPRGHRGRRGRRSRRRSRRPGSGSASPGGRRRTPAPPAAGSAPRTGPARRAHAGVRAGAAVAAAGGTKRPSSSHLNGVSALAGSPATAGGWIRLGSGVGLGLGPWDVLDRRRVAIVGHDLPPRLVLVAGAHGGEPTSQWEPVSRPVVSPETRPHAGCCGCGDGRARSSTDSSKIVGASLSRVATW